MMSQEEESPNVFGLAIIGCGQIATHHVEAMACPEMLGKICLRALVDPSTDRRTVLAQASLSSQLWQQEKQQQQQSPKEFDSLENLIADKECMSLVDILFIAVPHDLHETLALQALSTHKIVVLENGTVAEEGTHETLLARDGLYASLCRLQFSDEMRGHG